jgi:peptidoglycan/LPS O-acetylase OafA/YrhL
LNHGQALRDVYIETLRGLACVLLVAFHVIGTPDSGMRVADHTIWRAFADMLTPLRMPLFAFISGFVLTVSIASLADYRRSLLTKLRRLALPLITASVIYNAIYGVAGMKHFVSSPVDLFFFPFIHLWYLQATILIMLLVLTLALITDARSKVLAVLTLMLSVPLAVLILRSDVDVFSLSGLGYLLPFFALGMCVRQNLLAFCDWVAAGQGPATRLALTVAVILLLLGLWLWGEIEWPAGKTAWPVMLLSAALCLALFAARLKWAPLTWLGAYSYVIFIFHPLFESASRHFLMLVAPAVPEWIVFLSGMVTGLILPIALHHVALSFRVTALLLLGIKLPKSSKHLSGRLSSTMKLGSQRASRSHA